MSALLGGKGTTKTVCFRRFFLKSELFMCEMIRFFVLLGLVLVGGGTVSHSAVLAEENPRTGSGCASFYGPVEGTEAFRQYMMRPRSDYSTLLYLIDRMGVYDLDILYDGYHYKSKFIVPFGRWFLARNYKNQTMDEWIKQWCNRSLKRGELIWVDGPDKKLRLSRDILAAELKALEDAVKNEEAKALTKTPKPQAEEVKAKEVIVAEKHP